MSATLRKPMSVEEFLAWEDQQEERWEFDGFEPVAMTGAAAGHGAVQMRLHHALYSRLRGKPCQVWGSELKISVAGSIRYPDAFVVCRPVDRRETVIDDPVVIFEILSPSTAETDRTIKNAEYRDTPSVRRYVMLEQDRQAATVYTRENDEWLGRIYIGEAVLTMPEIGIELPLSELYEGLDL